MAKKDSDLGYQVEWEKLDEAQVEAARALAALGLAGAHASNGNVLRQLTKGVTPEQVYSIARGIEATTKRTNG